MVARKLLSPCGFCLACRFLGVDTPDAPFPRKNEGASEMAWQIVRFIVKNPLAVMGLTKYQHKGPLDFDAV